MGNLAEARITSQELAAILYHKSKGNPLYLYYLLQECENENLTLEQINQLPQGLTKFYEKQWRERIWIGDNATKEGRKQILCLLLILKEPPSKKLLLELTNFDQAELQEYITPLRRFMRIGERYAFFHDSFKNFLQQQFEKTIPTYREKLIEHVWHWRKLNGELLTYALFWLPTHLLEAKCYEDLFALARDAMLLQAQVQVFHDDPGLPLRTLQTALQGAIEADNAVRMAEFLLSYARQAIEVKQESPLEALRTGNLNRAWELADLFEIERCVLWHLLLAWELKDMNRLEEARAVLERLRRKELSYLSDWQGEYAAYFLAYIFEADKNIFKILEQQLLQDADRCVLSEFLSVRNLFANAVEIAQEIKDTSKQAETLQSIARAQAKAGEFSGALETAQKIAIAWIQFDTMRSIVDAQLEIGEFQAALKTVEMIKDVRRQRVALQDIIKCQIQAKEFISALEIAQKFDKSEQAETMKAIARAQAKTGKFSGAMETAQKIGIAWIQFDTMRSIVDAQIKIGEFQAALKTAEAIKEVRRRNEALQDIMAGQKQAEKEALLTIVEGQVQAGEFQAALTTVMEIENIRDRIKALETIAVRQARIGERDMAQKVFTMALEYTKGLKNVRDRTWALEQIAIDQAWTGEFIDAFKAIQKINDKLVRTKVLWNIAMSQASHGDIAAALKTTQMLDNIGQQKSLLSGIVWDRAGAGDFLTALEVTQGIDDTITKTSLLEDIAKAQIRVGEFTAAIKIAQRLEDAKCREVLQAVIEAQIQAEEFSAAINRTQIFDDIKVRSKTLKRIAQAQCQIGKPDAARTTFAGIVLTSQELDETTKGRAWMLQQIAQIQAQNRENKAAQAKFAMALKIAQKIKKVEDRILTLAGIALAQAQTGERDDARKTLDTALNSTSEIANVRDRLSVLEAIVRDQIQAREYDMAQMTITTGKNITLVEYQLDGIWSVPLEAIAMAQIQAGNLTAALTTAKEIGIRTIWGRKVLQAIVHAQAHGRNFSAAFETAQIIYDTEVRAVALGIIAKEQALAGDRSSAQITFATAFKEAQWIGEEWKISGHRQERLEAILSIARAQAQVGEREAARMTLLVALETTQEWQRRGGRVTAWELTELAETQAQIGEHEASTVTFAVAMNNARHIKEAVDRVEELRTIAQTQARVGELAAALMTAEQIENAEYRIAILQTIAQAQVQMGEGETAQMTFIMAIKIAQTIEEVEDRVKVLQTIAHTQIRAGFGEQAVQTAMTILTNRNKHLPEIAETLVDVGNKEHFKQLLIPCAAYLDSAYRMCGLLARLYPEQATAIAEILLQQEHLDKKHYI
ncbi:tetratricopeptide repeat domain protein [Candidatus Vecturithrix granuli]|uniref:Tetratricopeptide repeat domain protein n=1 Tax=Vecturithrix granuli TaxID=1499967 RepID=A0A081BVJ4_VECG1|nr:tetratricopeptide repeat domain protein [Candidatus Vecturithrix granuli]